MRGFAVMKNKSPNGLSSRCILSKFLEIRSMVFETVEGKVRYTVNRKTASWDFATSISKNYASSGSPSRHIGRTLMISESSLSANLVRYFFPLYVTFAAAGAILRAPHTYGRCISFSHRWWKVFLNISFIAGKRVISKSLLKKSFALAITYNRI